MAKTREWDPKIDGDFPILFHRPGFTVKQHLRIFDDGGDEWYGATDGERIIRVHRVKKSSERESSGAKADAAAAKSHKTLEEFHRKIAEAPTNTRSRIDLR